MVDLHSHILPYIDDGASSLEEALRMAEMAAKSGVNHMVASSHGNYYPYTIDEYKEQMKLLQSEIDRRDIPVTLYPGMEIFMDEQAFRRLEMGQLLSVNDTDYLLIEFPFEEHPDRVCRYIERLQAREYRVIVAHPERYIFMQKDPELAWYLAETGCVLQMNKGSILGDFGTACQSLAGCMLDGGIIKVIATDAHDTDWRSPNLGRLINMLKSRYSPVEIRLWLSENPSRILKGYPTIGLEAEREEE